MKALRRLAWLVWLAHASRDASDATARDKLRKVAVGVNTGGPRAAERIDAARASFLRYFSRVLVMGDVADAARGIESPPRRYYCARDSDWGAAREPGGRALDGPREWGPRGRCTQLRFLYLVLALRERWPGAPYFLLLDDDVWIDPAGVGALLFGGGDFGGGGYDPDAPWLMGPSRFATDGFVVGSTYAYSRALATALGPRALVRCASQFEFACSVRGCCDHGAAVCASRAERAAFDLCDRALASACAARGSTSTFRECARALHARGDALAEACAFNETRPEHPTPMYYYSER